MSLARRMKNEEVKIKRVLGQMTLRQLDVEVMNCPPVDPAYCIRLAALLEWVLVLPRRVVLDTVKIRDFCEINV